MGCEWWRDVVVYQIYPRSFDDSDGDGIGDLRGIGERVEYLSDLGVGAVWLCPVYDSPGVDNGYDVRDYRAIDPQYGTMADFEALVERLHDAGIRLLVDVVFNHTSDEHRWFRRSRDTESPFHDWYYWREGRGADGTRPPNNWTSFFGGSAWTYDEGVGKWYLHLFSEHQPDLDWRNPAVRDACVEVLEFWLGKGVDGFRFDVLNLLSKREGLPDGEPNPIQVGGEHFLNGPRVHEYVSEIHERALAGRDLLTAAELGGCDPEEAARYLVPEGDGLSMAFAFEHLRVDHGPEGRWDVQEPDVGAFCDALERWQIDLEGWPALFLGNHDEPRLVSRFGDGSLASAKCLATLLFTLRGTPFVYQGDELGMPNYPWERAEEFDDLDSQAVLEGRQATFLDPDERLEAVRRRSRDNARVPMPWTAEGEFTDGKPWLPEHPETGRVNAAAQREDPDSVFTHYRRLIHLRAREDALVHGRFERVEAEQGVFAYTRTREAEAGGKAGAGREGGGGDEVLVALNLTADSRRFRPSDGSVGERLFGTHADSARGLRPWEANVWRSS